MQTVSWSELEALRQCPLKWKLAYDERWQGQATGTDALSKGSCYHSVKEAHFKALMSTQADPDATPQDRLAHAVMKAQERIDQMREANEYPEETVKLIEWMYVGYVERYGIDPDWRIMAVESSHVVPLYEPIGRTGEWQEADDFNMKIKLDLMVTDRRDRLWIVDHKSAGKVPTGEKDFQWADQFGIYQYGVWQLGYRPTGTIHNCSLSKPNKGDLFSEGDPEWKSTMKATDPEKRFKRTFMDRTMQELRTIQWEALQTFRNNRAALYHPRHPDEERCKWKCNFNDACNMGRRNGEEATREYLLDIGFSQEFRRN